MSKPFLSILVSCQLSDIRICAFKDCVRPKHACMISTVRKIYYARGSYCATVSNQVDTNLKKGPAV